MRSTHVLTTVLLAALTLLVSLAPASSATKEESFWAWFQANEATLYSFERGDSAVTNELMNELHKVHRKLSYEIWSPDDDGRRNFIVSADGYVEAFPEVEALHDAAPKLPRWSITKFRPREILEEGKVVVTQDGVRQAGDMRYVLKIEEGMAVISLYLPGAENRPSQANNYIARLHLLDFLGEEDFGLFVRQISVLDVTDETYNLSKPIFKLPAEFDAAFKN